MDNNNQNMDFYTPENGGNAAPQQPVGPKKSNGLSIAAMVLGIVTAVLGWCCCPYLAIGTGIAGIVLACLSRKGQSMDGKALAGLICSIVGIAGAITSIVLTPILNEYLNEYLGEILEEYGIELNIPE